MKMRKKMMLLKSLICGAVLFTDCGKDDNIVEANTMPIIRKKDNGGFMVLGYRKI